MDDLKSVGWDDANMKKIIRVAQMFTQPLQRCFQHWFNSMNHYLVLFFPIYSKKKSNNNRWVKTAEEKIICCLWKSSVNQMDFTALTGKTWSVSWAGSVDMEKVQMLQYVSPKTETWGLQWILIKILLLYVKVFILS